ncbi:MAG: DNA topoisomerase VI subunit B, partial [Nitrosopumilus sp.]|nr:DNA topoisomerase VI subunit B [Nitrosopumilus sp.]NNM03401.1 DNA topoisomerase VI subunit B [Nitrosopumilus sp.]
MSLIKEKFNQISPSEFFYSNRDLAGFSNPTRSLYTAVREFVENALDACDQKGILPDVHLTIKAVDPDKSDPKPYILTVKDNGPGIDPEHIPLAFGTVLYGSKFGLKQARGMFGLGATMAILYGQITTNKPVTVKSSIDGQTQDEFELLLDIQKNKPVIVKHNTKQVSKKGLSVSICLEGDYSKAGNKIRDYVYETSLITPYASIIFDDPKGEKFSHPRFVKDIPPPPTIIRPHPHGIDVERIRRMIVESQFEIPNIDDAMIEKVRKDLGLSVKNLSFTSIMDKAKKKWKTLSRQVRVVIALMSFLKMDFEKLNKIKIEDIDMPNKKLFYWDFGDSQSKSVEMDPESQYFKQLTNTVQGEPLTTFLTKRFQRIGPTTALKFAEFSGFKPEKRMGTMTNQELVNLSDSLQKFEDFLAPDPSCLAPLGEGPLEKGIQKFFNPDFAAVVQRPASAYSGFPFIIEMGIAYGGDIKTGGPHVYRYANRIPLLYDEGSDVVLKVVNDTDWGRYKIKGDPPFIIVSHICSTRIPYKTAGKENVADRPEIERELRLGL